MKRYEIQAYKMLIICLIFITLTKRKHQIMEKEYRIRPYYKSELAEAYAPFLTTNSALNRLALWIDLNPSLSEALARQATAAPNASSPPAR